MAQGEGRMARYFYDVYDRGRRVRDDIGMALDSVAAAINEASTVIDNLADAARFDVRSGLILVSVRDEAGQCRYEASASLVSD